MLIDAAESQYYPVIEEFLQEQGVERLDVVVASHPHSDHIGAMAKVIQNFEIGAFYLPDKPHTTATYERMIQALEDKEVAVYPAAGSKDAAIAWDPLVTVSILSPVEGVSYDDLNNVSAVSRVSYGDTSILFPGDAEDEAQEIMLSKLPDVYKRQLQRLPSNLGGRFIRGRYDGGQLHPGDHLYARFRVDRRRPTRDQFQLWRPLLQPCLLYTSRCV